MVSKRFWILGQACPKRKVLHHLGCKSPVNNGINYQPQLVKDYFHQQYHETELGFIMLYQIFFGWSTSSLLGPTLLHHVSTDVLCSWKVDLSMLGSATCCPNFLVSRWWQLKSFFFSPRFVGKWSKLDYSMFQMGCFNHQFYTEHQKKALHSLTKLLRNDLQLDLYISDLFKAGLKWPRGILSGHLVWSNCLVFCGKSTTWMSLEVVGEITHLLTIC